MLRITYMGHSGFFAETENACLLFDYYTGELPRKLSKPLYIFASHRHGDHFNHEIFRYGESFPGTRYILSRDISLSAQRSAALGLTEELQTRIIRMRPDEQADVGTLQVQTLRSTDEGVAFFLRCDGHGLYHAGDLNLWLWGEEDTPLEAEAMRTAFYRETEKLVGVPIDAAFLPLDPRQPEDQYWLGLDHCARIWEIGKIFPMHFWGKYETIGKLKALPQAAPYAHKIVELIQEGQNYEL